MPISTNKSSITLTGNGAVTAFDFDFRVWDSIEIEVWWTVDGDDDSTLIDVSEWSVVLNEDQQTSPGGTLTYPVSGTPLPLDDTLTIKRTMPFIQDLDVETNQAFDAEVIERSFDIAAAERQELKEGLDRAVTVDPGSPLSPDDYRADFLDKLQIAETIKDESIAARDAALVSETNAATSETNAATSETNAAASEANALYSENEAKVARDGAVAAESAVAISETNAATSETNAAASEAAAAASESASLSSEANAAVSEANSLDSENAAATSETNAAASEAAAAASEYLIDNNYSISHHEETGVAAQNTITISGFNLAIDLTLVKVYIDGVKIPESNLTRLSDTQVQFTPALSGGEHIELISAEFHIDAAGVAAASAAQASDSASDAAQALLDMTDAIQSGEIYSWNVWDGSAAIESLRTSSGAWTAWEGSPAVDSYRTGTGDWDNIFGASAFNRIAIQGFTEFGITSEIIDVVINSDAFNNYIISVIADKITEHSELLH